MHRAAPLLLHGSLSPNNKFLRPTLAESAAFGMNHFQPQRLPCHRRPQRSGGGAQRLDGVDAAAIRRMSYPQKTRKTLVTNTSDYEYKRLRDANGPPPST